MAGKKQSPQLNVATFDDHQIITQPNPLRTAVRRVAEDHSDDPIARAEQALSQLSDQFDAWMLHECERLSQAYDDVKAHGFDAARCDELFRAAHDIKGGAATFGFPLAAVAAESLCRILEHAPDIGKVPPDLLLYHVEAVQAIVREHHRFGVKSTASELGTRLRSMADTYLTAVNQDRPEHLEVILAPPLAPINNG